ncbi:MAG: M55 family metallopeptidase [Firmicutes bacterium]|nr:M55 family metallopeptidase [Bacillota bacterium]
MRIYISADGEGVSTIVSGQELYPGNPEYGYFRERMTADVNAAIRGAFAAGATEVLVNDTHWSERNLLPNQLDPRAQLLRGSGKPLSMMEGVKDSSATLFVGYHGRVGGSRGVANETVMGKQIYDVRVNGLSVGELEINAAIAGHFGVPVILVTGDDQVAMEAAKSLPDAQTAVVKFAIERWSARCLSPAVAEALIQTKSQAAVEELRSGRTFAIYRYGGAKSLQCEVEFISTAQAGAASLMPGTHRIGTRTVMYDASDALIAMRAIFSIMFLGCQATDEIYG